MNVDPARKHQSAHIVEITAEQAGRRIDNFLQSCLDTIPKTRIYRMLRKGEVRVDGRRIKPDHRLQEGDKVRIPPLYLDPAAAAPPPPGYWCEVLEKSVLYQDDKLLLVNKPAGIAVHAGTGEQYGVIEILRHVLPGGRLELVHRLDKDTSGCLLIARDHRFLRHLNAQLRDFATEKYYLVLLKGHLPKPRDVDAALDANARSAGERRVRVDKSGKPAHTTFTPLQAQREMTLARATIRTGRTHQIRVHAAAIGHPVAGDDTYGDRAFNRQLRRAGLKRMFLHAESMSIQHPETGKPLEFSAPLADDLSEICREWLHFEHE